MKRIFREIYLFIMRHMSESIKKRVLLEATSQTIKRFLTDYSDADAVKRVIDSQRFRTAVRPVHYNAPEADNILIYAAHQDDETIGAAGTFLRCVALGKQVRTIYVTNGATKIKPTSQDAEVRKEEAGKVWEYIGTDPPHFWGLPSKEVQLTEENAMIMREQIEESGAECLFIPFFLEQPLEHRQVNELLLLAHRTRPLPVSLQIWAYQVSSMLCPNVVVDISELIEKKCIVNDMWKSQNISFNYSHYAKGMAAYNSIYLKRKIKPHPVETYAELFFVTAAKDYISILDNYYN